MNKEQHIEVQVAQNSDNSLWVKLGNNIFKIPEDDTPPEEGCIPYGRNLEGKRQWIKHEE